MWANKDCTRPSLQSEHVRRFAMLAKTTDRQKVVLHSKICSVPLARVLSADAVFAGGSSIVNPCGMLSAQHFFFGLPLGCLLSQPNLAASCTRCCSSAWSTSCRSEHGGVVPSLLFLVGFAKASSSPILCCSSAMCCGACSSLLDPLWLEFPGHSSRALWRAYTRVFLLYVHLSTHLFPASMQHNLSYWEGS